MYCSSTLLSFSYCVSARELLAIVRPHHLSQTVIALELLKYAYHAGRTDPRIDLDMECFAIEIIHNVEGAEASAARQRVAHEIHRPHHVMQPWYVQRCALARRQATLGGTPQVEFHRVVDAVDALAIPVRPLLAQLIAILPEASAGMSLYRRGQCSNQLRITHGPGTAIKAGRAAERLSETYRASRREVQDKAGIPASRAATSQSGKNGQRQLIIEGQNGTPKAVTQHPADKDHANPHWHAADAKTDPIGGELRMNRRS